MGWQSYQKKPDFKLALTYAMCSGLIYASFRMCIRTQACVGPSRLRKVLREKLWFDSYAPNSIRKHRIRFVCTEFIFPRLLWHVGFCCEMWQMLHCIRQIHKTAVFFSTNYACFITQTVSSYYVSLCPQIWTLLTQVKIYFLCWCVCELNTWLAHNMTNHAIREMDFLKSQFVFN
jgi:hypothetical protein